MATRLSAAILNFEDGCVQVSLAGTAPWAVIAMSVSRSSEAAVTEKVAAARSRSVMAMQEAKPISRLLKLAQKFNCFYLSGEVASTSDKPSARLRSVAFLSRTNIDFEPFYNTKFRNLFAPSQPKPILTNLFTFFFLFLFLSSFLFRLFFCFVLFCFGFVLRLCFLFGFFLFCFLSGSKWRILLFFFSERLESEVVFTFVKICGLFTWELYIGIV